MPSRSANRTLPGSADPLAVRLSIRLLKADAERIDAIAFEVHQRLGKRITVTEVLKVGLARISGDAPITRDEMAKLKATDRRRRHPVEQA
jgi:hypothetical protein